VCAQELQRAHVVVRQAHVPGLAVLLGHALQPAVVPRRCHAGPMAEQRAVDRRGWELLPEDPPSPQPCCNAPHEPA
jgi:hypothetical protein